MSLDAAVFDRLFADCAIGDAPGFVVGVAERGQNVVRRAFGLASIEHGVANTVHTRMRIGSVSKHMTALAALLLAEDGALDLDAPAAEVLPELPEPQGRASIRQFLNHTSGVRCHLDLAFIAGATVMQPPGSALSTEMRQGALNFEPGDGQIYCNGGYHLASLAIERAAKAPFETFMKTRLFEPLDMHNTESVPSDMIITPGIATMHAPFATGQWRRGIFPNEEVRGEGGVVSTIDDMLLWLGHLRSQDRVGTAATWNQLLSPTTLNNGHISPYALGTFRRSYRGVEIVHHAGGVVGGTCQMISAPSLGLDIILLANGGPVDVIKLGFKIVDAALETTLAPPAAKPRIGDTPALDGARYHCEQSCIALAFGAVGDELAVSFMGSPLAPALHLVGENLSAGFEDAAVGAFRWAAASLVDKHGAPAKSFEATDCGRRLTFTHLPLIASLTRDAAQKLMGAYYCNDLDANATIEQAGEGLLLRMSSPFGVSIMHLEAWSDHVLKASLATVPEFCAVIWAKCDDVCARDLRLSTPRTRNLLFSRITND